MSMRIVTMEIWIIPTVAALLVKLSQIMIVLENLACVQMKRLRVLAIKIKVWCGLLERF